MQSRQSRSKRKRSSIIIHVRIRSLPSQRQDSSIHTPTVSYVYPNFSQQKSLWANPTDYRCKQLNNFQKKNKVIFKRNCKITIIVCVLILAVILLAVLIPLLLRIVPTTSSITRNNVTLRWNTTGITVAGISGLSGNSNNQLYNPWGLALTYNNTLYIVDRHNHRVQKYSRENFNGTTVAGLANSTACFSHECLSNPSGIALDEAENIYISVENFHYVVLWKKNASLGEQVAGTGYGNGTNQFSYPYNIVHDPSNNTLYVSDSLNHRIMRYTSGINAGVLVAGGNDRGKDSNQLNNPVDVYFESLSNSLIIANTGSNNIVRWPIGDSNWTLVAGNLNTSSGNSPSALSGPFDLTLDPMGNLYVADTHNHRIQFFSSGEIRGRTIAGVTGASSSNPNHLQTPYAIILDNHLNLYVADYGNHRVQKFLRY